MMKLKLIIFISGLVFSASTCLSARQVCLAAEPYTLEKIVVKSNRHSGDYSAQTFTDSDIKEKNLNSLADLFSYAAGMDLRYRGTFGVQGDLSLRGSTYEQVAVAIDGVNLMDPQTGHHNLDIPLTVFDVDRIEITRDGASSRFGAGAFAGGVNIITKKPAKENLNIDTLFGEHALFDQAFSMSLPKDNLSLRVSFDHKISKAARPNTDFEYKTGSVYLKYDLDTTSFDNLFGYQKKDFGADSFYSNLFPEEEEHTETIFNRTGVDSNLYTGALKNNLFFKKHRDKFILRRNNPASVNYHTTYIYGLASEFNLPTKYGNLLLGIDAARDEINSTNLGKHDRFHAAGSFGFTRGLWNNLDMDFRLRVDRYQKWDEQLSYNLTLGYVFFDGSLNLGGAFARAFRIPSFTELYYSDAANKGNPDLKVENSDTFRLGLDFKKEIFALGLDAFLRRGRNIIDWTRTSSSERWNATNLGSVDFRGFEFRSNFRPDLNYKGFNLTNLDFSYNYNSADKKAGGFFSKYALDILKHQFILGIYSKISNLNLNWELSYNRRYYGETYFVGNLYAGWKIISRGFSLEPYVKIDNFSNAKYTEVAGVLQPGRWVKSGLKFEW